MSELAKDPRMQMDFGSFMSMLVWWPIAQVLEEYDPRFIADLQGKGTFRFPDGTIRVDTTEKQRSLWLRLDTYREAGLMIRQNTIFRALKCFPTRRYQFLTTWEYFDRIGGEGDFLVNPVGFDPTYSPEEYYPDNLRVDVYFWRKPNKAIQAEFVEALKAWDASVRSPELFGATGQLKSEIFAFDKKIISFRIAATGQDVITWLAITALNFGARIAPIWQVRVACFDL